eukprot:CAMPEP_0176005284 /NCGR_PEP_ID=MMETSP0120_2-20121206/2126_1 /TAXON_ID=160619 /ORGANISM="Kryptoperidinium foliaceum, Strain CCMP 1326" /LENGTH=174 /DNA_ID=CAMNT_0017337985 /DNA_START=166 /DNA_END=686 /DNA_ORIENTATION=-
MTIQNNNLHRNSTKRTVDKSPGPSRRCRSRSIPRNDGRGRSTIRRAPRQHDRQLTPAPLKYPNRYSSLERRANPARPAAVPRRSLTHTTTPSPSSSLHNRTASEWVIRSTHSASEPETATTVSAGSSNLGLSSSSSFHGALSSSSRPSLLLGASSSDHESAGEDLSFSSGRASL